jgi:uncharacterized membrane protein
MIFSKQNEPLIRPSDFKTFLQHENSTNIENRLCLLHSLILGLETIIQIQRSKK